MTHEKTEVDTLERRKSIEEAVHRTIVRWSNGEQPNRLAAMVADAILSLVVRADRMRELAEEVVSAANIVSHDGYYEVDIDRVEQVLAAALATTPAPREMESDLAEAMKALEPFVRYGSFSGDDCYTVRVPATHLYKARATFNRIQGPNQ